MKTEDKFMMLSNIFLILPVIFAAFYPNVIIRDKEKQIYYKTFSHFREEKTSRQMEQVLYLALSEGLHKRIAYLEGLEIVTLAEYAKSNKLPLTGFINAARRQTIPAFREKGVWKIGQEYR